MARLATSNDIPALHALIESAYRGDSAKRGWTYESDLLGGQRTDVAMLETQLGDPRQSMLVIEDGPDLLACVALEDRGSGLFYLGMLTVDPTRQAGGVGKRLLGQAEAWVREHGGTRIEMTVIRQRTDLIGWYERRGYTPTGEARPFPAGDPRYGLPKRDDLEFAVLEKRL
ncbi:GNAT family N-acetyltransferase [Sphingomicrobium nitratireducens]|uniref:GNAT family N-acetyltransferase n=1 Tax=Sphingomicrobium nitratireducens TaxID=2964666 RepID=UPI002240835B|nr:GNAT family N-acetyltransferase [Sphingomicrobium nitratireducens]